MSTPWAGPPPFLRIEGRSWLRGGTYTAYDTDTGEKIGWLTYLEPMAEDHLMVITSYHVDPAYRRRRVGTSLLHAFHDDHPDHRINSGVRKGDAQQFYLFLRDTEPEFDRLGDPRCFDAVEEDDDGQG